MTALNPAGFGGNFYNLWGGFNSIVPGYLGGDIKKAAEFFNKAISTNPDFLNHYYARARYLDVKNRDREAFRKDLNHILAVDISKKTSFPYHWGTAYKFKAKQLLDMENNYF